MATNACSTPPFELLTNPEGGNLFWAIKCSFTGTPGVADATLALFLFGTLGVMYYTADGSVVIPLVMSIMLGSIVVAFLPAGALNLAVVVLVFGVGAGVFYLLHRARPVG